MELDCARRPPIIHTYSRRRGKLTKGSGVISTHSTTGVAREDWKDYSLRDVITDSVRQSMRWQVP